MMVSSKFLQGNVHDGKSGFFAIISAVLPLFCMQSAVAKSVAAPQSIIATSQTVTEKQATNNLNTILLKLKSVQATFTQTTKSATNKVPVKAGQPLRSSQMGQAFSGVMQVKRPGLFRWEVTKPMKQMIVSNSKTVWIYDPDLAQATRQTLDVQVANTPALLLSGNVGQIAKSFKVTQPDSTKAYFKLYPITNDALFEVLTIEFDKDAPATMLLTDTLGQETQVKFSNITVNGGIDDALFKFIPPKGVDVIDQ